jgi:hypothetical protein
LSATTASPLEIELGCRNLALLLSMIAIPADDLPVITDSETFSDLGQNVKVPSLLFGIAIIMQEGLTRAARRTVRLLIVAFSLILTAGHSQADLGWTLAQFEQQYGKPVLDQEQIAGRIGYVFTGEDYIIAAFFGNTQVLRILYICRGGSVLDWGRARALLRANAPDAIWDDASKNEADNSYRVNGTKDGVESYYASLSADGKMLAIWTKEDDEAERTKPRLETPSVSSVADSNEKNTGEITAGHRPSTESELTPEINHPEVPANATSSSPARQPASAHAFRTKIARVEFRSSMSRREIFHAANLDAKVRPTALSHQHAGGHPAPTPLLMNAGTGLYNSEYTQPFKNQKKAPGP